MNVLVDTPVWSLALRRRKPLPPADRRVVDEFHELIAEQRVGIIGPIRQEVLSGILDRAQFERLRDHLRTFDDIPLETADYERAAEFYTGCRSRGVQGSHVDFLICAVAKRHKLAMFSLDRDFARYAPLLGFHLHRPREAARS